MSVSPTATTNPVSPAQGRIFQRLRWRLLRNTGAQFFSASRMRIASILVCSILVAGTVGFGSWEGFHLLEKNRIPFAGGIIGTLFDLLFLTLSVLLFFSTGIIMYGSLFSSAETAFLLSLPARADHVFTYKFQTAVGFSSWAFVLLGLPILLAYGIVYAVSWPFFLLLPLFLLGFVLLPAALGAGACMAIVNLVPQRRKQMLALLILAVIAVISWRSIVFVQSARATLAGPNRDALGKLFGQFEFARSPFMPSHWMTRGLQSAARGDFDDTALPLALIWSNGLFAFVLAAATARYYYRRGYNRIATGAALRKRFRGLWLDKTLTFFLRFLDPQTRLLIIKDLRTFRRDPAQWAQILIFAGLVMLYIVNSRQFYEADLGDRFANLISLVNLCATATLMCAFMGRFIYPLVSLEGKKFWILGLLPMPRQRLLWGKFLFAALGAIIVSELLVVVSDVLLAVRWEVLVLHIVTVLLLSVGLAGLSVGLGACLPNFRESDPSKIAVGFGGTLNLIAGLLFLLLTIGFMALPYHVHLAFGAEPDSNRRVWWFALGIGLGLCVAVAAVVAPLRLGIKALQNMEF